MTDTEPRWKDSLAAAAASAYEAAHGSAIPESRRGLRLRMTWQQATAAVVLLVLLVGAGWWFTRPDAVEAVPLTAATTGSSSAAPTPAAGTLVVDVSGAVVAPGLVTLAAGDRVADAIDAAGGASADAVLDGLNLARHVTDGEQILVPHAGEIKRQSGGLININQADADALEQLPGVGPVLAGRIVADRDAKGPFGSLKDLGRVSGVGDAILAALEGVATV